MEEKEDIINRPNHYCKFNVELESLDMVDLFCFNLGSCIKYALRYRDKGNPVMDLQKALFYANRLQNNERKRNLALQQLSQNEAVLQIFQDKSKDELTIELIRTLIDCMRNYHWDFVCLVELLEKRLSQEVELQSKVAG